MRHASQLNENAKDKSYPKLRYIPYYKALAIHTHHVQLLSSWSSERLKLVI